MKLRSEFCRIVPVILAIAGISAGFQEPESAPPIAPEEILVQERTDIIRDRFETPAFWGTTLVNLPTPRPIGKGDVLFRVSHRFFPAVKEGYDFFYGLDGPASILLGLGYGFSDNLDLTLTRANLSKELELALQWTLGDQTDMDSPFSAAIRGSASLITLPSPEKKTFHADHTRLNFLASLAYRVHPSISLLLVPGYSTNTAPAQESSRGTLFLGVGGRVFIANDYSVLLEWIPVLSGYALNSTGWALGIEKKIGAHVFQVFVLNSIGISTAQFVPGGDFRIGDGEYRIGFNILRWF